MTEASPTDLTRPTAPRSQVRDPAASEQPWPGPRHLRRRDLPARDDGGHRRRRVLVLGQHPAHPARRRRRRARRRRRCCPTTRPNAVTAGPRRGGQERLHRMASAASIGHVRSRTRQPAPPATSRSRHTSARSSCASSASRRSRHAAPPRPSSSLPVPMGSPQNYYGVGYPRPADVAPTTTTSTTRDTGPAERRSGTHPGGHVDTRRPWHSITTVVSDNDDDYAPATTRTIPSTGRRPSAIAAVRRELTRRTQPADPIQNADRRSITGIEVAPRRRAYIARRTCNNTRVRVQLSWNNGPLADRRDQTPNLGRRAPPAATTTSATTTAPPTGAAAPGSQTDFWRTRTSASA